MVGGDTIYNGNAREVCIDGEKGVCIGREIEDEEDGIGVVLDNKRECIWGIEEENTGIGEVDRNGVGV